MSEPLARYFEDPKALAEIPASDVPALLAQLAAVQGALAARLLSLPSKSPTEPAEPDTLLTAEQAAPLLNVTPHWLYRHAKQLPFTRRLSRKVLRFSESGLRRWQGIKRS